MVRKKMEKINVNWVCEISWDPTKQKECEFAYCEIRKTFSREEMLPLNFPNMEELEDNFNKAICLDEIIEYAEYDGILAISKGNLIVTYSEHLFRDDDDHLCVSRANCGIIKGIEAEKLDLETFEWYDTDSMFGEFLDTMVFAIDFKNSIHKIAIQANTFYRIKYNHEEWENY